MMSAWRSRAWSTPWPRVGPVQDETVEAFLLVHRVFLHVLLRWRRCGVEHRRRPALREAREQFRAEIIDPRPLVQGHDRDRTELSGDCRGARCRAFQASRNAAGELYDKGGVADREALERGPVELENDTVANRANARASRRPSEQAELADAFAGGDLAEQAPRRLRRVAVRFVPDLQAASHEEVERVGGVALAHQPLAAVQRSGGKSLNQVPGIGAGQAEVSGCDLLEPLVALLSHSLSLDLPSVHFRRLLAPVLDPVLE